MYSTGLLNHDVSRRMHEMTNHYISLEEYFMVESVQKVSTISAAQTIIAFSKNSYFYYTQIGLETPT